MVSALSFDTSSLHVPSPACGSSLLSTVPSHPSHPPYSIDSQPLDIQLRGHESDVINDDGESLLHDGW